MLNEVGRTDNNENKPLDIEFKKIKISSTINVIFELN